MTTVADVSSDLHLGGKPHHLVSLLVENKAGVLVRIAGLFSRRGFNIFSLAVAPTNDERFSRVSVVVDAESAPLEQILSQINKLINVVEISEMRPDAAYQAELLLMTVVCAEDRRGELAGVISGFGGEVVDSGSGKAIVKAAGAPSRLDQLEKALSSFSIVELQRTGRIALPKLSPADQAV